MFPLLEKYLRKKGIDDPVKLSPEEKATFDSWEKVLNKDELSIDDIKKFCQGQIGAIENRWKDLLIDQSKKAELIPYHTVYKIMLTVTEAPKQMREALETQLNQMINQS